MQVSEQAPANGSIQTSITNMPRLAQLHVWGSPQFAMSLPPGFGGLSAITSLILCTVGHPLSNAYPRQSVVHLSPELMTSADDRTAASPAPELDQGLIQSMCLSFNPQRLHASLPSMQVRFCEGVPLQGGLHSLRVLEVGGCTGLLPIACALPALQASYAVQLHRCHHRQARGVDGQLFTIAPDTLRQCGC